MKIVKVHKKRSPHSQVFGVWSGKTLASIPVGIHDHQVTAGGLKDQIDHIKVGDGSHDAFLWFDDPKEAGELGQRLIELAEHARLRKEIASE